MPKSSFPSIRLSIALVVCVACLTALSPVRAAPGAPTAAISLSAPYAQDFNTLSATGSAFPFNSWVDDSTLPGWYAIQASGAITTYRAGTGSSNAGALYSFGTGTAADRALGTVASGSTSTITNGARFLNDTGKVIASVTITYTGEQWRNGGNTTQHKLDFQYQVDATSITAGVWTDVNGLDFTGPIATATATALDGDASANRVVIGPVTISQTLANGQEFWIRWLDPNDTGNDHGLAVDDFSLSVAFAQPSITISTPAARNYSASPDGTYPTQSSNGVLSIIPNYTLAGGLFFKDVYFRFPLIGPEPGLARNYILNADGGPGQNGSVMTLPNGSLPGGDSEWDPGETLQPEFRIGLMNPNRPRFTLSVDIFGTQTPGVLAAQGAETAVAPQWLGTVTLLCESGADGPATCATKLLDDTPRDLDAAGEIVR